MAAAQTCMSSGRSRRGSSSHQNWTNSDGTFNQSWVPGVAIFAAPSGIVTLGETINARALQFMADGYRIEGNGFHLNLMGMADGSASIVRVEPGSRTVIAANLTGANGLRKMDGGTLVLANDNAYTGGTTISAGTLQIGAGGTTGGILGDVVDDSILAFARGNDVTFGGVVSGSGRVVQVGSGVLTLSGANTYQGGTILSAGTTAVSADENLGDAAGTITFNSGTLRTTATLAASRSGPDWKALSSRSSSVRTSCTWRSWSKTRKSSAFTMASPPAGSSIPSRRRRAPSPCPRKT